MITTAEMKTLEEFAIQQGVSVEKLMENAVKVGNYLMGELKKLDVKEVRGKGLMVGVELKENKAKQVVETCSEKGLLLSYTSDNTLRFLPPLIISEKEVDEGIKILKEVL